MKELTKAKLLRVFISSTDKLDKDTLYESIVFKAKEAGLAGATVYKGAMGYGASSVIHSYKFWEVAEKLPVVVEIIAIRKDLEAIRYGCLVTMEDVTVLLNKAGQKREFYF